MENNQSVDALRQKLVFRWATEKDYQAVIDIDNNIYGGTDYIPALYMKYVRDPCRILSVAELDGKVVALSTGHVVDDGLTIIGGAARVVPTKQGAGIWHIMKNNRSTSHGPLYEKLKWLTVASSRYDLMKKFTRRDGYDLTFTRNLFTIQLSPDAPTQAQTHKATNLKTKVLSKAEIMQAMGNPDNLWQLFPHRKLVYSWDPYMLLKSNLERIYDDSYIWVATKDVTDDNTSSCKSISIGRTHFIAKGTRYDIDFYGNSLEDLRNHLVIHMNAAQRISVHSGVHVNLFVHRNFDCENIQCVVDTMQGLTFDGKLSTIYVTRQKWLNAKL